MAEPIYAILGDRIQKARKAKGMTQQQIGDLLGMTRANVANLEAGKCRIYLHNAMTLCRILGIHFESEDPALDDAVQAVKEARLRPKIEKAKQRIEREAERLRQMETQLKQS